ncbi:hypothetical protein Pst134EA_003020 [Puccinia striiformis f. sp. tritici]|uniref:hypothetical protein n=1 Tax=Puccinia striiformis f. sp. tritici TaxID=168172 RepID=UPI00200889B8|nr:hypothetical protein Pst134EA_003020 [Puccinia striiformis f. sp. tritici]KAH9472404.1 hypothetical protein Pst134EA_003020 [Puccinia striiformis f. sp. tritici]
MIINLTTQRHHSLSLSSINDQSMIINLTTRRHHSLVSLPILHLDQLMPTSLLSHFPQADPPPVFSMVFVFYAAATKVSAVWMFLQGHSESYVRKTLGEPIS